MRRRDTSRAALVRQLQTYLEINVSIDYYGVVSICDTHGIHLPVDCIEMVVEIVRHADLASNKAAVAQSTQTDASMGDLQD